MADGWLIKGEGSFEQLVNDTGAAHVIIKGSDVSLGADVTYIKEYDQVSDVLAYAGKALPGSAMSSAVWQVTELTFTAGGNVSSRLAEGDALFNKIWDNRGNLSYS